MPKSMLRIGEASKLLGVHPITLRTWTAQGKIHAYRGGNDTHGQRRYLRSELLQLIHPDTDTTIKLELPVAVYCRVSSHGQKKSGDLERQKLRLLEYSVSKKYQVAYVFADVGSGLNSNRKYFIKLLQLATQGKISKVVIENTDRLIRFNYTLVVWFLSSYGVTVECVETPVTPSFETELVHDLVSILTVFSAKLYGKRSAKHRKTHDEN